jgi:RNA polymerase sigma-70 factor (ECF subfamily)
MMYEMPYCGAFVVKIFSLAGRVTDSHMGNQIASLTLHIMDSDENLLVQNAAAGDALAFGKLYDRYQPMIYRFIAIKVGRREDAEDLTHQVFLSAWQGVNRYQDLGHPFSSWLYRIARNQVIDHYRAKKPVVSLEVMDAEAILDPVIPQLDLPRKLDIEKTLAAVRTLSHDHQDVVVMRFIEDLSLKETARAMKRTEGAIKLLQHRAIKELQKILASGD